MKPALSPLIALILSITGANATVIIGNLATFDGVDDSTTTTISYNPGNPSAPPPTGPGYGNKAVGFAMGSAAYSVTSLTLRLRDVSGNGDTPVVSIWSGTAGPVTQIGTFNGPASYNGAGTFNYVFTPSTTLTLNANTSYFIVVQQTNTAGPDRSFIWENGDSIANNSDTTPVGAGATYTIATYGGAASPTGITTVSLRHNWYQLEGNLIPEPSTTAIAGLGILTLALRRRRA